MEPHLKLRQGAVATRSATGEYLGLDLASGQYFALNESAGVLWPALEAGATEAELRGLLVSTYSISGERAAASVEAFVSALRDNDLLDP
jgi:hypothetical protein